MSSRACPSDNSQDRAQRCRERSRGTTADTRECLNAVTSTDVLEDTEESTSHPTLNYRNTEGFRDRYPHRPVNDNPTTHGTRHSLPETTQNQRLQRLNAQKQAGVDTAAEHHDDAGGASENEAEAFRNTTLTYRNQAEGFRDEAQTAAQALGAVEIKRLGREWSSTVNGTAVAKIDASGNFLVAGDIGVQQNI